MRDLKSQKPVRTKGNRRKRQKQPLDWKRLLRRGLRVSVFCGSVGLAASGGMFAGQLISDADFFRVATVRVEDGRRVSEEEVLALADISPGGSIFDLDLEAIGRKIEENPWVAGASVARIFPREVEIRLREREPTAVVSLDYLYYADGDGEVFKLLGPEDRLDYPVVTGLDRRYWLENPEEARRQLREAMALFAELEGREVFGLDDVSGLHLDREGGLVLYTCVGGVPIRMGYGNFISKLDRLERIYRDLEPRLLALKHIDLNVADRVIVRLDTAGAHERG